MDYNVDQSSQPSKENLLQILARLAESAHQGVSAQQDAGYGNLKGLENVIKQQKGYSDGGEVEAESPIMAKIREYVLGHGGLGGVDQKEAELASNVDPSTDTVKGYADGGMVQDEQPQSDWDSVKNWITATAPQASPKPLETLPGYKAQAKDILQGGTQGVKDAYNRGLKASAISQIPAGIAGIGDAIVNAAGGHSNQMGALEEAIKNQQEGALKQQEALSNMGKEQFGLEQNLQAKSGNTDLSKIAQQTYGPLLLKMGFRPEDIAKMPASLISDLTGKSVDAMKADAEAQMAAATLGLKRDEHKSNEAHQHVMEDLAKDEQKTKEEELRKAALLEATKHPILHPIAAFRANKELQNMAGLNTPAPAAPEERVDVISPTGQHGHIPKSQLDAAIKKGYKLVP